MNLKGDYNSGTSYSVGDVVKCSDGYFYYLFKPCAAGTTPTDSLYWNRLEEPLASCCNLIMSFVGDTQTAIEAKIPSNISDEAITLTAGDDDYLITVDASGEDPELAVTKVEEEAST